MSVLTLKPQTPSFSLTPKQKKWLHYSLLTALCLAMFFLPYLAHAANPTGAGTDMFAAGKGQIKASAGSGSTLWFAMTVVGLAVAAVTGFVTKNWFAAIGGFFAGMIFLNVTGGIIGLA